MLKLNNLNESLEKIYESNAPLTEAFNDSFPQWLKDRLAQVRMFHGTDDGRGFDISKLSSMGAHRPEYTNVRGYYGSDRDLGLFNTFLKGTDPQKVQIIEGPKPEKRTDERLKEPNIPIWGFPNGQVYIQGFNDNERFVRSDGKDLPFKHVPAKFLISDADKFAYIDGTTLPQSTYLDTRKERAEAARELRDMNYGRKDKDPKSFVQSRSGWGDSRTSYDKSGYIVNPAKYKDALGKIKADNYAKVLEDYYQKLLDYRDDIASALSYYDPREDIEQYKTIRNLYGYLVNAIDYYNDVANDIERIAERDTYSEDGSRDCFQCH